VSQLISAPVFVLLLAALAVVVGRREHGRRIGLVWLGMIAVLLVSTLVVNNPIGAARFRVGVVLLGIVFVLPWRRWSPLLAGPGLVLALVAVFPFADVLRSSTSPSLQERVSDFSVSKEITTNGDFDAFQMIVNTRNFVEASGPLLGRQITGSALFWVPRSFWRDKPLHTGELVGTFAGYSYTNLSAPLWAELFVDGGWILLILGFWFYGRFVKTLDHWHVVAKRHGVATVASVVVPIYAGYQLFLLRGALMPALAYLTPMVLLAIVTSWGLPEPRYRRSTNVGSHASLRSK
jgi:hypothetical protein